MQIKKQGLQASKKQTSILSIDKVTETINALACKCTYCVILMPMIVEF